MLYQSGAIVDPGCLVETMTRPVRAIWVADGLEFWDTMSLHLPPPGIRDASRFLIILCCNSLHYNFDSNRDHVRWMGIGRDDNDNTYG